MLCCFTIAHFLGNPSPKSSDPCPSPPHVLSGNTCALLVQTVSESTSHIFNAKSRRYHWKWDMVLNSQELLGVTVPSHKLSALGQLPRLWLTEGAQGSCVGAKEHSTTRADICILRGDPNKEDLPSPPCFQQLRCPENMFSGHVLNAGDPGWGEWVATLRLNLVHTDCLRVCVANHKLHIQP